jgi:hypothetical protein
MRTYSEILNLARMCARNAHVSSNKQVARELWKMGKNTKPRLPSSIMAGCQISATRRRG